MRRRRHTQRRRTLLFVLTLVVAGGFGFVTTQAFTAANTVPATTISQFTQAITPAKLEPSECVSGGITATSIVAGTGTINATAASQLVLGSSGVDTISDASFGLVCMVGGAGADSFTGPVPSGKGDLCIVSAATLGTKIKRCTVVATRP
jgi:hypothetical protein